MITEDKTIIGRAERVILPDHGEHLVPAKVDSGADVSSIWASDVVVRDGCLEFVLFDKNSEYYTGHVIRINEANYRQTRVASSFGHKELRYAVKMRISIFGRVINATFTLADRSQKTYPILLGRRLLKNKFLVDVSKGQPLLAEEKVKRSALSVALAELED